MKNKTQFRVIAETIPHGIEEIDASGIPIYGNRGLHKLYGYGKGKLLGMSIFDLEGRWADVNESALRLPGYERNEIIGRTMEDLKLCSQTPPASNCCQQL